MVRIISNKFFSLMQDVFVVEGAKRHAIYDLSRGYLFSINDGVKNLIKHIIKKEINTCALCAENKNILQSLIDNKILCLSPTQRPILDINVLKKKYPISFAWIEVTKQCNLSCKFCYERSNIQCSEKMSIDNFLLTLKNLKDTNIRHIQFIGGEPLIIKDQLKKMIDLCKENFSSIEVFTNGVLINKDWCDFFKQHSINLAISIHSYLSKEHDKVVGCSGAHKKIMTALELVRQYKIPYRLATTRNKDCNIGHKTETTGYLLTPTTPKLVGRARINQYNFNMFCNKAITKQTMASPINKTMAQTCVSGHQCFNNKIYIASDLEVYPCVMERRVSYGNLNKKSLQEVLNHKVRFISKDKIEVCCDCEYRYACFDCRPDSNGKKFYQKPWYCSYDPYAGEWGNLKLMYKQLCES